MNAPEHEDSTLANSAVRNLVSDDFDAYPAFLSWRLVAIYLAAALLVFYWV